MTDMIKVVLAVDPFTEQLRADAIVARVNGTRPTSAISSQNDALNRQLHGLTYCNRGSLEYVGRKMGHKASGVS